LLKKQFIFRSLSMIYVLNIGLSRSVKNHQPRTGAVESLNAASRSSSNICAGSGLLGGLKNTVSPAGLGLGGCTAPRVHGLRSC
jgi:hypothetical protein